MATGDEDVAGKPRVAQTVEAILKAMGVESYDPRVVNQLLELLYRHVSHVLDDARVFSEHADKQCINADDIKLAIRSRVNFAFTQPPPRDVTVRLAKERNAIPLPPVDSKAGIALPKPEFQLTAQNYQVIVDPNRNPPPVLKSPKSPRVHPRTPRVPKSPRSPKVQRSPQNQKSPHTGNPTKFHKSPQAQMSTQFQNPLQMQNVAPVRNAIPMQNPQLVQKSPMRRALPQAQRPSQVMMPSTQQVQKSPMQKTPLQVQRPAHFMQSPQRQKNSPLQRSLHGQRSPNLPKSPRTPKSPKKSPKRARASALTSPSKRQKINVLSQMPPPPEIVDLDGPSAALNAVHSPRQAGHRNQVRSPAGSSKRTGGTTNSMMRSAEVITIPDDPSVRGSGGNPSSMSPRSRMGQRKL